METLIIREATPADVPDVMRLIAQSDMSPDTTLSAEEASKLFETIKKTGCHQIFVAVLDSSVVGTFALITVQQLSHNGGKSMIVEDVVIKSNFQGKGLGQQMMTFAIDRGRATGCYKMILSSGKARARAHEFYEQLGFEKDGYRFALGMGEENSYKAPPCQEAIKRTPPDNS